MPSSGRTTTSAAWQLNHRYHMPTAELDRSTPELARLADAMEAANKEAVKEARKAPFGPKYKAARVAYKAYWAAVDAKRNEPAH